MKVFSSESISHDGKVTARNLQMGDLGGCNEVECGRFAFEAGVRQAVNLSLVPTLPRTYRQANNLSYEPKLAGVD